MSAIDHLRSFAETRAKDYEVIRDGITYGHARAIVSHRDRLVIARQDAERRELVALAELDEANAELRTLRRELAARMAVDGWEAEPMHGRCHRMVERGPVWRALERDAIGTNLIAEADTAESLATALGLDFKSILEIVE